MLLPFEIKCSIRSEAEKVRTAPGGSGMIKAVTPLSSAATISVLFLLLSTAKAVIKVSLLHITRSADISGRRPIAGTKKLGNLSSLPPPLLLKRWNFLSDADLRKNG